MKYEQSFQVAQDIATVWAFFGQFDRVAWCMPGLQKAEVIDADSLDVVLAQRVGPMTATFQARVQITERVEQERLGFTSVGKAVRGAIGNFRSSNTVMLKAVDEGRATEVTVTGEVALGGALGSLGQKVVARQAEKMTAEFARQLERVLSDGSDREAAASTKPMAPASSSTSDSLVKPSASSPGGWSFAPGEPWPKRTGTDPTSTSAAALLFWTRFIACASLGTFLVGLIVLWRIA